MSFLEGLPFYNGLEDFINNTLGLADYIQDGYNYFANLDVVTQLIALLVLAIIVIIGTFELLKKLSKLIIVVGIIAFLWFLYDSGALNDILPSGSGVINTFLM